MKYYIIKNKQMPWGDYGNVLAYGFISKNATGDIIIERIGPMIPAIYLYNKYIAVVDGLKNTIESSSLKGYVFKQAKKEKIVKLEWEGWDANEKIHDKPKSGEPEDFILKRKHDPELAEKLPGIWVMILNTTSAGQIDLSKKNVGDYSHISIDLTDWDGSDLFRTPQLGHLFCTEKAKEVLEKYTAYLNFFEIQTNV
ncbi:hypothetical protein [Flavobacterium cerinum]|uniref:Uncharacterized protein n=1 Tax=Flavobacterium cerinum TaxID=2502784 RepID=A0A3S3QLD5_9FLAO|nr:hypothetical protein [Flavobacterium cerinum]RWW91786.1 hypothetical protein EPI11_18050 [Flavobacterium cerinum]